YDTSGAFLENHVQPSPECRVDSRFARETPRETRSLVLIRFQPDGALEIARRLLEIALSHVQDAAVGVDAVLERFGGAPKGPPPKQPRASAKLPASSRAALTVFRTACGRVSLRASTRSAACPAG